MRHDFHIVIVGGGMVGACAAALAAADPHLGELRIAVLEAHPPTSAPQGDADLRVSAVSRASQRILGSVGAWSLVPSQFLSPYEEMIVWDADGKPGGAGAIHFSASATSEPNLGHIVENRQLLWALYDSPPFRQRITLLRAELADMTLERDRAVVSLGDGRTLSAALVVGSDGAASLSRKLAGIETAGWNYDQRAFVTHVRTERPHARTAWQRFLADGPIAFLPLADGRSSIVWTTRPAHAEHLATCPPEEAAREVEQALDAARALSVATHACAPVLQGPVRARRRCRSRDSSARWPGCQPGLPRLRRARAGACAGDRGRRYCRRPRRAARVATL
jgi:2-octaprenylphenol hydroxylase